MKRRPGRPSSAAAGAAAGAGPPTAGAADSAEPPAAGLETLDAPLSDIEASEYSNMVSIFNTVFVQPAGIVATDYCDKQRCAVVVSYCYLICSERDEFP